MERQELVDYLKDVYEVKSQGYLLWRMGTTYEKEYEELEKRKNVICICEEFTEDTIDKFIPHYRMGVTYSDPNRVMTPPSQFETLPFKYNEASFYLPPRYLVEFNEVVEQNSKIGFIKMKPSGEDECSPSSKIRKKYQALYTKRYNSELAQKRALYDEKMKNIRIGSDEIIRPRLQATEELATKMFALNILHPKYQNFMAVAQIYEYFDTGRCDTLEGPYGAYNLYEQELRQNIIIKNLGEVVERLDELNRTMSNICSCIQIANSKLSQISSLIGQIEANTACMAYDTQCIAYNTSMINKYHI